MLARLDAAAWYLLLSSCAGQARCCSLIFVIILDICYHPPVLARLGTRAWYLLLSLIFVIILLCWPGWALQLDNYKFGSRSWRSWQAAPISQSEAGDCQPLTNEKPEPTQTLLTLVLTDNRVRPLQSLTSASLGTSWPLVLKLILAASMSKHTTKTMRLRQSVRVTQGHYLNFLCPVCRLYFKVPWWLIAEGWG